MLRLHGQSLAEFCKPLGNFCTYRVRKSLKCKNCNHQHDIEASNDDVHISFEEPIPSDCRTIEEILNKNWTDGKEIVAKCQSCSPCKDKTHSLTENLVSTPKILVITLNR